MKGRFRHALVTGVSAVVLLCASAAHAQGVPSVSAPRGDVFGGLGVWSEEGSHWTGPHLSAAFYPTRHVGIVGDLAFYRLPIMWVAGETFYEQRATVMGGVRFSGAPSKVTVFGQVLVGRAPLDDFAIQPGLGVDVRLGRRAAVRLAGDMKFAGDDGATYLGGRFSTGVVLNIGHQAQEATPKVTQQTSPQKRNWFARHKGLTVAIAAAPFAVWGALLLSCSSYGCD